MRYKDKKKLKEQLNRLNKAYKKTYFIMIFCALTGLICFFIFVLGNNSIYFNLFLLLSVIFNTVSVLNLASDIGKIKSMKKEIKLKLKEN